MKLMVTCIVMLSSIISVKGETFALKTNALGWAAAGTVNLGGEVAVARHSTIDLVGNLNPWTLSGDKRMRFWSVVPEYRYWFCNTFNGHFLGVHLLGGEYNVKNFTMNYLDLFPKLDNGHYEGWLAGAGLTYGYQWMLSKHWNLEASLGVGYAFTRRTEIQGWCEQCPKTTVSKHYFGPTKAALSVMYIF